MRKAVLVAVAFGLAGCGAPESSHPGAEGSAPPDPVAPAASPSSNPAAVYTFEGTVDPVTERMTLVYRTVTGEVIAEPQLSPALSNESPLACAGTSVDLPYATSGSAGVFLHTKNTKWQSPILQGGVAPQNLYVNAVCNFAAVIDSISPTTVTIHSVTSGAPRLANWSCSNGAGQTAGIPPCTLSYGAVSHTGTTSNDAAVAPWQFNVDATGSAFTFKGRVTGVQPPS